MCCRASPVCAVARAGVFRVSGWIGVISHVFVLLDFYLLAARCSCSDGCLSVFLCVFLVVWFVEGSVI